MKKFYSLSKAGCAFAFSLRRVFVLAAFLLMGWGGAYAQPRPGAGWEFYRDMTLTAATPVADFQVRVVLNGAAQHVHMKADGGDLRFYSADGSMRYEYFLEKFDPAGISVIWVKVPDAGENMIRMYYGNTSPGVTSESDGYKVFDFFDDFEGNSLKPTWQTNDAGGNITVNGDHVKLETTNTGVVGIAHELTYDAASNKNIIEVKHKEGAFYRNRYVATNSVNINSAKNSPTMDYGYFAEREAALSGYLFFMLDTIVPPIRLTYNKNYITSWNWEKNNRFYGWALRDFDDQNTIDSRLYEMKYVPLKFISVTLAEKANASTSLDWVRTRKGQDILAIITGEQYTLSSPLISEVPASVCEGEVISIKGSGFLSQFPTTLSIGAVEATDVFVVSGTEVSAKVAKGATGKLKIISGGRAVESANDITVHLLPAVSITTKSGAVCQGDGPITLDAEYGEGTVGVEWRSSVSGGSFANKNNANTTWTPPAGISGPVEFTISTIGSACAEAEDVLSYVVNPRPVAEIISTIPESQCKGENIRLEITPGFHKYNFILNGNTVQNDDNNIWESNKLPASNLNNISIQVSTDKGCSIELGTGNFAIYASPSGQLFADEASGNSNDSRICEGAEVNLSYIGTTKSVSFSFFMEDADGVRSILSADSNDSTFTYTGNLPDKSKFGVIVKGLGNCESTFWSNAFTVDPLPQGAISPSTLTICEGEEATFSVPGTSGTFVWYRNNVPLTEHGNEIIWNGLANGDEIGVKVTDENMCSSTLSPVPVTVNKLPTKPVITGENEICAGSTIEISVPAVHESYQWYLNGSLITGETDNSIDITQDGNYSVEVSDGKCSIKSDDFNITELTLPAPPTITSANGFCAGGAVILTSSYDKGHKWFKDGVLIENATSKTYEAKTEGDYTVRYTDGKSCTSESAVKTITEYTLPAPPAITVEGTTVNDIEFCAEESAILEAPAGYTYIWHNNKGPLTTATTQTLQVSESGSYKVVITNSNGCSSESQIVEVTKNPLPEVQITASEQQVCPGATITYTAIAGMKTYVWVLPDGETYDPIVGKPHQISVTWSNTTGLKNVRVIVSNEKGCTSQGENQPTEINELTPTITEHRAPLQVNICQEDILNYETQGGFVNYEWSITGGKIDGDNSSNTIRVKWNGSGERKVSVNYTDGKGCQSPTPGTYTTTVNPLPDAIISGATTVCQDAAMPQITFTGSGASAPYTFDYYINNAGQNGEPKSTVTGSPVNVETDEHGEFVYHLWQVTDAKGCFKEIEAEVPVTITKKPSITDFNYGTEPFFCSNSENTVQVNLVASPGRFSTSSTNLTVDPETGSFYPHLTIPGTYNITYRIVEAGGCAELAQTTPVTITPLPVITKFYYGTEGVVAEYCKSNNSNVLPVLTGNHLEGGNYTATDGLVVDPNTGSFNPITQNSGTYTITYTIPAANGCGEVFKQTEIKINPIPAASISYANSAYCSSDNAIDVTLAETTGGTFSITSGGASINSTTGAVNANNTFGTYNIKYIVPAAGGCAPFEATTTLRINPKPEISTGASVITCADGGAENISGATAENYTSLIWSTAGDGTWQNENGLNNVKYTPGATDIADGEVQVTLTAYQEGCAAVTSSKDIIINANPTAVVLKPEETSICLDAIAPLTSVKEKVLTRSKSFENKTQMTIPDNLATGIKSIIKVSGIEADAIIDSIRVILKIDHPSARQLVSNLRSPYNKELNLFYRIPQEGANFDGTIISSASVQPIQTFGSPPYSDIFSPQAQIASMGLAFAKTFSDLYANSSTLNGDWTLKLADNLPGEVGELLEWSIEIYYSVPENPIAVVWAPLTDLYLDAAATLPYNGESVGTVYAKPSSAEEKTYTATNVNGEGCTTASTVTVDVKPSPKVSISTDYCLFPGYAALTAVPEGAGSFEYNWNTAETSPSIKVDLANDYYVSITDKNNGCVGTAVMSIATELVVNGDFEQGNIGFHTDYEFVTTKGPDALNGEGKYTVDVDASEYHKNFFGRDHSTLEQNGQFLIVNGYNSESPKVIWQQTVKVEPNTNYYYSAWAKNLNNIKPFAKLRFEVNGVQVGSIADLSQAGKPQNNNEININDWVRFYFGHEKSWNSGEATTAIIKIINLETAKGGNDFGLDDISFATISPFVTGPEVPGSDQQLAVCSETEIIPISYEVGTGASGPKVTGLPLGVNAVFDGLNLRITGIPKNEGKEDAIYNYAVSTEACNGSPKVATGTIIVKPRATLTQLTNNSEQDLCMENYVSAIKYKGSDAVTDVVFEGLPAGITGNYANGTATITGASSIPGTYDYTIRTLGEVCAQDTMTGKITVSPASVGGSIGSPTICVGQDATLTLSGNAGEVQYWEVSDDEENWSMISNSNDKLSLSVRNVRESKFYRATVKNELCSATVSATGKIRITNLWEGRTDTTWEKSINWSSGTIPKITDVCSNTVTIPPVPAIRYNPVVNSTVSINNLDILPGGNLKVKESGNLQIAGNIRNQGTLNVLDGELEFIGSVSQSLSGNVLHKKTVKNLTISNSNSLNISNTGGDTLNITGSLKFGKTDAKLYTGNNITLKSTHSATANVGKVDLSNLITGQFVVERFINTGTNEYDNPKSHPKSWQLLSTPVKGVTIRDSWQEGAISKGGMPNEPIEKPTVGFGTMFTTGRNNVPQNGFDVYTLAGPSIKSYIPATNSWNAGPEQTTNQLYNENGYLVLVRGDRTVYHYNHPAKPTVLRAKGSIITGPVSIAVLEGKFQSVGNPYPSAVKIKDLITSGGVNEFIIVWDPTLSEGYGLGGYVTLAPEGDVYRATPATGLYSGAITHIQSGQAFFVQSTGAAGTVQFTEDAKSTESSTMMRFERGGSGPSIRINLYDRTSKVADGIKLDFSQEYSNDLDGKDARKMQNSSENLSIATGGKLLVIERRKLVTESDTIFLNLTGVKVQNYHFEFDPAGLEALNVQAFLEDTYKNSKTPLSLLSKSNYSFKVENIPGSYASRRFRIVFKQAKALQVTFVSLKAHWIGEGTEISWSVENAKNMKSYTVQRSFDGYQFNDIHTTDALGDKSNYKWVDGDLTAGVRYYRISAIDEEGRVTISGIVKTMVETESSISIYPNPIVNNTVNIHLNNLFTGKYLIRVIDPQGRLVLSKEVKHPGGNGVHKLPWDRKLSGGIYQVEVIKPDSSKKIFQIKY